MTGAVRGPVLELGCGTGRVTMPLAHDGVHVVGVDRSAEMLERARRRVRRQRRGVRPDLVRGDIRHLPFPDAAFPMVIAPYGILQSLLSERDLKATLADVARVVERDGYLRSRAGCRPAVVGRVRKQVQPARTSQRRRTRWSPWWNRSDRTGPGG